MKKLITLFLALIIVLAALTACGTTDEPEETTPAQTTAAGVDEQTTEEDETTTAAAPGTTKASTTAEETTAAPKVEIPVVAEGLMVYFEDFDNYVNTEGNEAVMALLDWQILNLADGALKDNTGTYSIVDGTFKFINYDGGNVSPANDSYTKMLSDEYMAACCQGNYTLQYDVKYIAAGNSERYAVIILNYDGYASYNSSHLRIAGSANNQIRFMSSWYTYDVAGEFYAADKADGDGSSTVFNKLTGQTYTTNEPFGLKDMWITIRYQANYNEGPTIYMRNNSQAGAQFVCVSKVDAGGTGTLYWNMIENYAVALKLGTTIDGYLDNIAIWTGLGDMPAEKSTAAYDTAIAAYLIEVAK